MTESDPESHGLGDTEKQYPFAEKELKVQRYFWIAMLFLLSAALLGAFGEGRLSKAKIETADLSVEYSRIAREETTTELTLYLKNRPDSIRISFNRSYLEGVRIDQIVPSPGSEESGDGNVTYTFAANRGGVIIFYLLPMDAGTRDLDLTVGDSTFALRQYIIF